MTSSTNSPPPKFNPDRLAAFFAAVAIQDPFLQADLEVNLQRSFRLYWQSRRAPAFPRDKLRQYVSAIRKKRALLQALGPAVEHQIMVASYQRENPEAAVFKLSDAITDHRISRSSFKEEEIDHEADIEFLLNVRNDYRKKLSQKFVVEPTLQQLKQAGVQPSRKLPLSKMVSALFDLFAIARRDRVTDHAVTRAWRELQLDAASVQQQQCIAARGG